MSYRFMRILLMFDLPTKTSLDLRSYREFKKNLHNDGFIMLQESIYTKLALNITSANLLKYKVSNYAPTKGNICILVLTEKQYANMVYITGERQSQALESTNRLVIL